MGDGVHNSDLIALVFQNEQDEKFTANDLTILYSPEKDMIFMGVDADPFRAAAIVKGENLAFTLHGGQVFAEIDFFRRAMKDDLESLEQINQMEASVRDSVANADMDSLPLFAPLAQGEGEIDEQEDRPCR